MTDRKYNPYVLALIVVITLLALAIAATGNCQQPSGISGQLPPQPQQVYWLPIRTPVRTLLGFPRAYRPYVGAGAPYTIQYQPVAPAQFAPVQPQGVQPQ